MKTIKHISIILIISLVLIEVFLRLLGYMPGQIKKYKGFNMTDDLKVYNLYTTNNNGAYTFNPDTLFKYNTLILENDSNDELYVEENISEVLYDFKNIEQELQPNNESEFLQNVWDILKSCNDTVYCNLLKRYLQSPFNKEGFRSVSFNHNHSAKKKVLLLGDSFVYGMSANPFYNSFADILLSRGYIVYNTGINGTDPAQYYAVAQTYIAKLEPDIVISIFSTASDLMLFKREPRCQEPHEHYTNAGFIESNPFGEYLSADEAYNLYLRMTNIQPRNGIEEVIARSSLLSIVYGIFAKNGMVQHPIYTPYMELRRNASITKMAANSKIYFDRIANLADKHNTSLINAVIPVKPERFKSNPNYNQYFVDTISLNIVFGANNYAYPTNLTEDDYEDHGDHFNNTGALKYANFLDSLIKAQ